MLPDTITVTVNTVVHTFTLATHVGDTKTYRGNSTGGDDLQGRKTLVIQTSKSNRGVVRRNITMTVPVFDSDTNSYPYFRTVSVTLNTDQRDSVTDTEVSYLVALAIGAKAEVAEAISNADI